MLCCNLEKYNPSFIWVLPVQHSLSIYISPCAQFIWVLPAQHSLSIYLWAIVRSLYEHFLYNIHYRYTCEPLCAVYMSTSCTTFIIDIPVSPCAQFIWVLPVQHSLSIYLWALVRSLYEYFLYDIHYRYTCEPLCAVYMSTSCTTFIIDIPVSPCVQFIYEYFLYNIHYQYTCEPLCAVFARWVHPCS